MSGAYCISQTPSCLREYVILSFYFQQFGQVEKVEFSSDSQSAILSFQTRMDAEKVNYKGTRSAEEIYFALCCLKYDIDRPFIPPYGNLYSHTCTSCISKEIILSSSKQFLPVLSLPMATVGSMSNIKSLKSVVMGV